MLKVERKGGLAGIGGPRSRIRSVGQVELDTLTPSDRADIDALFGAPPGPSTVGADRFWYRLTREGPHGPETVDVPEDRVPPAVAGCVKDELA